MFNGSSYQWDTTIKNHIDPTNDSQTQELSVIDFDLFNIGTNDVYGFEVVNTGNADFKFFFANTTSAIPEPGSATLLIAFLVGVCARRRRSS